MSRGHRYEDIVNRYTLDQFYYFLDAAIDAKDQELLDMTIFERIANNADELGWKKFLRELKYQRIKRESMRANREGRPVPVNVQGIERLLGK